MSLFFCVFLPFCKCHSEAGTGVVGEGMFTGGASLMFIPYSLAATLLAVMGPEAGDTVGVRGGGVGKCPSHLSQEGGATVRAQPLPVSSWASSVLTS